VKLYIYQITLTHTQHTRSANVVCEAVHLSNRPVACIHPPDGHLPQVYIVVFEYIDIYTHTYMYMYMYVYISIYIYENIQPPNGHLPQVHVDEFEYLSEYQKDIRMLQIHMYI